MNRSGQSKVIAGVDEAGRGSVIGPLVVAGIGIKESKMSVFRKLCLRDSKTLSRKSRSQLVYSNHWYRGLRLRMYTNHKRN